MRTGETLRHYAEKYGLSKPKVSAIIDEMSKSKMRIGYDYKG